MQNIITKSLSFQSTLRKPLLKLILILILALTPLGMISEFAMMGFIWSEGNAQKYQYALIILICYFISMIAYFSILGIPGIMMGARKALGMNIDIASIEADCDKVKDKLLKLKMILAITTTIAYPGITFLTYPNNVDQLLTRYVIYTLILPLLWLPINFFAVPLIVMQKTSVASALMTAYAALFKYWKRIMVAYLVLMVVTIFYLTILLLAAYGAYIISPVIGFLSGAIVLTLPYFALAIPLIPLWYAFGGTLYCESLEKI